MEMELMDNGLPLEEQITQSDAVPEVEPDSVGTMEDTVILAVVKYDYERSLIYGRILSKW